jgi:type I restriction enzyme R subunit
LAEKARAMVITSSIVRAIEYYYAIEKCLQRRKSPYRAIIAFSGEKEYKGKVLTEASINGFPSSKIESEFKKDPYRFLVVANKFQTGYDEPLLHTMYVDKALNGVKAVQTLSRLNRAYPGKRGYLCIGFCQ